MVLLMPGIRLLEILLPLQIQIQRRLQPLSNIKHNTFLALPLLIFTLAIFRIFLIIILAGRAVFLFAFIFVSGFVLDHLFELFGYRVLDLHDRASSSSSMGIFVRL